MVALSEGEGEEGVGVDLAGPDEGRDGARAGVTPSTPSNIPEVHTITHLFLSPPRSALHCTALLYTVTVFVFMS